MASSARKKAGGITAWRITTFKTKTKAFNGEGAWKYGGRWNQEGYRAVYMAESISLCALEILVHVDPEDMPSDYHCFEVNVPAGIRVERIDAGGLPKEWRRYPPHPKTQQIGTDWLKSGSSVLLSVPSALIPSERIYVLNPEHKDFEKIVIGDPEPFRFDPRLVTK